MRAAAAHQALQQLLARRPCVAVPLGRSVPLGRLPSSSSATTTISFRSSLTAGAQHLLATSVFPAGPYGRRRFSNAVGVRAVQVNDPGAIDSPLIQAMEKKIKEQLNADIVVVKDAYGDGRHVRLKAVDWIVGKEWQKYGMKSGAVAFHLGLKFKK